MKKLLNILLFILLVFNLRAEDYQVWAKIGETVRLCPSCKLKEKENYTFVWVKDDKPLKHTDKFLTIEKLTENNVGNYTVTTSKDGEVISKDLFIVRTKETSGTYRFPNQPIRPDSISPSS